jgi:hypothetical protein
MLVSNINGIKVYDLNGRVNVYSLRPDFARMSKSSYTATFRRQNKNKVTLVTANFKFMSSLYAEEMTLRSVLYVMEKQNITEVSIMMKRFECQPSFPLPKSFFKDTLAVMCFGRENIMGGVVETVGFSREATPFEVALYPEMCDTTVSQLHSRDDIREGYTDIMFFLSA